jgi:DNA-binding response OmpR family regulator
MVTPIYPASQAGLTQSPRVQFLEGLSPRLNTLSAMVDGLTGEAASNAAAESLVRRLRAMRSAADAVGLEEIGAEFDGCAAALAGKPWSAAVRSELLDRLKAAGKLGYRLAREAGQSEPEARPSGPVPALPPVARATPVGPFAVVALASESQKVILRQALERTDDFNLYCTQDAGEAAALLATYDPDLFVVDGRRADVSAVIGQCEGCAVMVVDARAGDVDRFKDGGARWVTTIGEHYETELLEGLRHRRRSQSMIAPRGDGVMSLSKFADEVAEEVKQALLKTANGQSADMVLSVGEGTSVQTAVWSMLARLRETVTELSDGTIKYDSHTPSGAMIVTGKDAMRRSGRTQASAENLAGRKILVAEDDTSVGWYLTSLLRGKGAIVTEAADGLEALRQARRDAPDLVICDVMLPALDGFALCRNLKHDVALSDVPVILLSWKEDLLQRVRELGAGADGYLAKEAEASVIIERCAEALEPRARIEKRLLLERVVHGRLDGVTPRLVLQLASRAVDNAKVILQDAAFQYEVCLGDGRILTARRKAADGSVESGEKVLPGLLGMRAGRFTVERIRDTVQAELYGSVDKVLAPFIERARRATRRLKGADLYDVLRLEVDTAALEPYLAVSPPIVNQVVARLRDGAPPGDLLHSVSASLLESVLEDLALRGGILRVVSADGDDLLDEEQRDSVAAFDMELRSSRSNRVKPGPGAPVVTPNSTEDDAAAAAEYAEQVNAAQRPSNRPSYAPVVVHGPSHAGDNATTDFEFERRSSPPSDQRSTVLGLAPEAPRPERTSVLPPLPQATLTRDEDEGHRGQRGTPTFRPPSADDTPPSGTNWMIPAAAIGGADPADGPVQTLRHLEKLSGAPVAAKAPSSDGGDEADGLTGALGGWTPLGARVSRREEAGRVVLRREEGESPGGDAIDLAEAVVGLGGTPTPAQAQVVRRPLVRVGASSGVEFGDKNDKTLVDPPRAETHTLAGGLGAPDQAVDAGRAREQSKNLQDGWRAPNLAATQAFTGVPATERIPPRDPGPSLTETSAGIYDPGELARDVVAPPKEEASTPAVAAKPFASELDLPVRPLDPPSIPPGAITEESKAPRAYERKEPTTDDLKVAAGLPRAGEYSALRRVAYALRPVVVVTGAAMAAFMGMNQLAKLMAPEGEQQGQVAPGQTAAIAVATVPAAAQLAAPGADDLAAAPPGEEKVARKTIAKASDLDLPDGLTVPAGKGLLEVDSGGQHKLYVDNVFVGRGPLRRIPIDPGSHQVQTQLDGVEEVHSVVVNAGRRARLELTESGQ